MVEGSNPSQVTMSAIKKLIRQVFRNEVFERDNHRCRLCNTVPLIGNGESPLDAHHITDRTLMPNGGYVKENGISLCEPCHYQAEAFHRTGTEAAGYERETLYKLIGSSYSQAVEASENLCLQKSR